MPLLDTPLAHKWVVRNAHVIFQVWVSEMIWPFFGYFELCEIKHVAQFGSPETKKMVHYLVFGNFIVCVCLLTWLYLASRHLF